VTTSRQIGAAGAPIVLRYEPAEDGGLPREMSAELALPAIKGSGILVDQGDDNYAGVLLVSIPPLTASAMGVLGMPKPGRDLSFLVIIGATFPPPGIQIGFGFAVTGIGGVVGVNRRIDRDALLAAIIDGSAADLLFPEDPIGRAGAIIADLPALFPPAPGSVVAGPMFQLSWGGRMVAASLAVLTEVSDRVRVSIIGMLTVAIPDPDAPLMLLRATFLGQIDPGVPSVLFIASLTGSNIVGMPLTGDLCVVMRGGADATFVLSAGGFHPQFRVPRGVPSLRRLGLDLSPSPAIEIRCEAYLAITTNTLQFGCRIELVAEVAGCGLRGHLGFDVLVQWHPHVAFIAQMSAGIAIEVAGESLCGVDLDFALSGPTPWRAQGRGSVSLFLFEVSFDFDEQWGSPPPALPATAPDLGRELRDALGAPEAWTVHGATGGAGGVRLTGAAERSVGAGQRVHPRGSLTARQRRVPLGISIERYDHQPVAAQIWDIVGARLGDGPAPAAQEMRDQFAPGQFLALTDDQQLSRPSFEQFRAGVDLIGARDVVMPDPRPADLDFETKVILGDDRGLRIDLLGGLALLAVETMAAAGDVADPLWWQAPAAVVTVLPDPPVTIASMWSMSALADVPAGATETELRQAVAAAGRAGVAVVEAWEVD
jgi:hypothetical protein